ncbi:site-specific DNA-methyltransferase, partial [Salmonella enterica subsp. enterica]|nr:site-specific DNA-methyltransferase [Salmonella enterica subsp. enterica serovar Paratyphi A]
KTFHPTQKPVSLFEYIIKTYTDEGETVLDNCMGGFTTAIACDNTNRNWIGFELQKEYCQEGLNRINENRFYLDLPFVEIKTEI